MHGWPWLLSGTGYLADKDRNFFVYRSVALTNDEVDKLLDSSPAANNANLGTMVSRLAWKNRLCAHPWQDVSVQTPYYAEGSPIYVQETVSGSTGTH
jgi:hypothetical protein